MNQRYGPVRAAILEALEKIALVKSTSIAEYIVALKEIGDEVEAWFEASLEAARDDLKRDAK